MNCPYCNGKRLVKAGFAYGAKGRRRQRYLCKNRRCRRYTIHPKKRW